MPIEVKPVANRSERRRFIHLPARLHRDHARWMPPIWMDERAWLDPRKNRAFSYCDTTLALAWLDGRIVGRVMGIINRRHNEHTGERTARFSCLESTPDPAVTHALLEYVEDWARTHGMNRVIGPFGFNDQDPEGFLIEGFEHEPTIVTYYNFPWLIDHVEAAGYGKEVDYFVYHVPVQKEVPRLMARIAERAERRGFREVGLQNRRELKKYLMPVLRLLDETFVGIYGFSPLDDDELNDLARKFLPIIDVRFVKVVVKDDDVVGFMVGIPNMYEGIVRAGGRLFPFGFLHILRAAKRTKQLDLLLGGIREKHRGAGIDALMGREMTKSALAAGFEWYDSHHELESNTRVRAEMERWGGRIYKKYRIFGKRIGADSGSGSGGF
jgi:hypothetical protein